MAPGSFCKVEWDSGCQGQAFSKPSSVWEYVVSPSGEEPCLIFCSAVLLEAEPEHGKV
jgi:hypothetical protein